ncbi:MAG: RHS repeat-associated core domain-containing protein [Cytophagales bacterium]|nr:RHS repeat-associated core domain-containing protein [Cytophagales bacterium]
MMNRFLLLLFSFLPLFSFAQVEIIGENLSKNDSSLFFPYNSSQQSFVKEKDTNTKLEGDLEKPTERECAVGRPDFDMIIPPGTSCTINTGSVDYIYRSVTEAEMKPAEVVSNSLEKDIQSKVPEFEFKGLNAEKYSRYIGVKTQDLNGVNFQLVAREISNPEKQTVIWEDKTTGGINEGDCLQKLWHADKIEINDVDNGQNHIVNADGKVWDGTQWSENSGQENYYIDGYTQVDPPTNAEEIKNNFLDAMERDYWEIYDRDRVELTYYTVTPDNTSELTADKIPYLLGDRTLADPTVDGKGDYHLIKVKLPAQPCELADCFVKEELNSCEEACRNKIAGHENSIASKAELLRTAGGTEVHAISETESITVDQMIGTNYPLSTEKYAYLISENPLVGNAYIEYQAKRDGTVTLDQCIVSCENGPTACESCDISYRYCTTDKLSKIDNEIENLLAKWDENGSFPYDLSAFDEEENQTIFDELGGSILYTYIRLNKATIDFTHPSSWSGTVAYTPDNCTTCASPGSQEYGCEVGEGIYPSNALQIKLDILNDQNVWTFLNFDCTADYIDCLEKDPENYASAQCVDNRNACFETQRILTGDETITAISVNENGELVDQNNDLISSSHSAYTCFDTYACETNGDPLKTEKLQYIYTELYPFYTGEDNEETANNFYAEQNALYEQYKTLPLSRFMIAVKSHLDNKACLLDCEIVRTLAFNDWWNKFVNTQKETLIENYKQQCFANITENFSAIYPLEIYHYTMFEYNEAGDLLSTIPPEGVDILDIDNLLSDDYTAADLATLEVPQHQMRTTYSYNSLGELLADNNPDMGSYVEKQNNPTHGQTLYLYDEAGRVRYSQTEEQRHRGENTEHLIFSYTNYDEETGRVIEVGEYDATTSCTAAEGCPRDFIRPESATSGTQTFWVSDVVNNRVVPFPTKNGNNSDRVREVVTFHYDKPADEDLGGNEQTYVDGRMSYVKNDNGMTYFSYDVHGRLTWSIQQINNLLGEDDKVSLKKISYEYRPVSGIVEKVIYETVGDPTGADYLVHRYGYDKNLRLSKVEVSKDGYAFTPISEYEYYKHGGLKNHVLGDHIQQLDYVYNLQGWLKSINNTGGVENNAQSPEDVFSEVLHYYNGDYKRTNTTTGNNLFADYTPATTDYASKFGIEQYNGNIATAISINSFSKVDANMKDVLVQAHKYDKLNRLVGTHVEITDRPQLGQGLTFKAEGQVPVQDVDDLYSVSIQYDANGNIESFNRKAFNRTFQNTHTGSLVTGTQMDKMSYKYLTTPHPRTGEPQKENNRLQHVEDEYDDPEIADIVGSSQVLNIGALDLKSSPVSSFDKDLAIEIELDGKTYWVRPNEPSSEYDVTSPEGTDELHISGDVTVWVENMELPSRVVLSRDVTFVTNGVVVAHQIDLTAIVEGGAADYIQEIPTIINNGKLIGADDFAINKNSVGVPITTNNYGTITTATDFTTQYFVNYGNLTVNGQLTAIDFINHNRVTVSGDLLISNAYKAKDNTITKANNIRIFSNSGILGGTEDNAIVDVESTVTLENSSSISGKVLLLKDNVVNNGGTIDATTVVETAPELMTYNMEDEATHNFQYDYRGRLIRDLESEIAEVKWNTMGKVAAVIRTPNSEKPNLYFHYNSSGMRVIKEVRYPNDPTKDKDIYYIYSPMGGLMATYEQKANEKVVLEDQPLYAAGRVGMYKHLEGTTVADVNAVNDNIRYEINDHIGNVRAVVVGKLKHKQMSMQEFENPNLPGLGTEHVKYGKTAQQINPATREYSSGITLTVKGGDRVDASGWILNKQTTNTKLIIEVIDEEGNSAGYQPEFAGNKTPNEWHEITQSYSVPTPTENPNQNLTLKVYFLNNGLDADNKIPEEVAWVDNIMVRVTSPVEEDNGIQVTYMADYYPYGMVMPGREYQNADEAYKYGFQGMEKDEDWAGAGNNYTTDFRLYDPRLGRWLTVDPLAFKFPDMSPYVGLDNNPINLIDPLGLASDNPDEGPSVGSGPTTPEKVDESGSQWDMKYVGPENCDDCYMQDQYWVMGELENGNTEQAISPSIGIPMLLTEVTAEIATGTAAAAAGILVGLTAIIPSSEPLNKYKDVPTISIPKPGTVTTLPSPVLPSVIPSTGSTDVPIVGVYPYDIPDNPDDPPANIYLKYGNLAATTSRVASGTLLPNNKGVVYIAEALSEAELDIEDVYNLLFINCKERRNAGDAEYVIIFYVTASQEARIQPAAEYFPGAQEYLEHVHPGTLHIGGRILYADPNPFESKKTHGFDPKAYGSK